ncbi:MAG TPA: hypothetical protein VFS56_10645 [Gemmatimonadaceae bacterium]|nr:hypothetical protein [Gemmatimonadaceae bacterium]
MAVNDDLTILVLDRKKLVARAFGQGCRRLVVAAGVFRFRRQWNGGDDCDAGLDAGLPQRRKQTNLIDRLDSNAIGDVSQETLGRLDQARAPETVAPARSGEFLSVSSRST